MLWFVGRNLPTYCRNPRRGKRGYDQKTYLKTAHNFANIVRLKKMHEAQRTYTYVL